MRLLNSLPRRQRIPNFQTESSDATREGRRLERICAPPEPEKIRSTVLISPRPLSRLELATEKAMLLSGEIGGGVPLQMNRYPGVAELLHKRYFEMLAALPNDETFSEPRAAMESPSRKELPKSE
jgi:hypothetical protein